MLSNSEAMFEQIKSPAKRAYSLSTGPALMYADTLVQVKSTNGARLIQLTTSKKAYILIASKQTAYSCSQ